MTIFSGFTAETSKNLLLDAGAFFKNFYVGTDTYASAVLAGKLIGATSGGGRFQAVPTMRPIEIDGAKGPVKGLQVIDEWLVDINANVKEVTKQSIMAALVATAVDTSMSADYDIITAKSSIALTDYIDNITWIGKLSGTNEPVIIQVYNVLNMEGFGVDVADKAEGIINLAFRGHVIDTDLETPPFKIYYPKAIVNTVDDAIHSFSKTAQADIVLTITSSDEAVCGGVSNGVQHLVSTAYTLGTGTVTLEKEYLATLTNGAYTFYLLMDKGNNISVSVTIGA